jgi:hypothetical protein
MKKILKIALLAFLVVGAVSRGYARIGITEVASAQAAQDWGATIRIETLATNQIGVWLEFGLKGKLQTYSSVQLEIVSGGRKVVSATLAPSKQSPDKLAVYFLTDPAYLSASTLTVYYRIKRGYPPYDGVRFKIADCIGHNTAH